MNYVYGLIGIMFILGGIYLIKTRLQQPASTQAAELPAPEVSKHGQGDEEKTKAAYLELAALLSGESNRVKEELTLFIDNTEAYWVQFEDHLYERGITEPQQISAEVALIDALERVNKIAYHDWKAEPVEVLGDLNTLSGEQLSASSLYAPLQQKFAATQSGIAEFLESEVEQNNPLSLFACARDQGLELIGIDEGSDAFALLITQSADSSAIQAAAKAGGVKLLSDKQL